MKRILTLLPILLLAACNMDKGASSLQDTTESKYRVGTDYSFKSRDFEPNARLTVLKIEHQDKVGNIIHVRVDSVKVKTSENPVKYSTVITHMPFSEAALDSSGLSIIGEAEVIPDYQEGYNEWRTSFDKDGAGVFSIPVSKAVVYMEETMLKGHTVDK
ncbi:MAG: hypothetical protein EOO60_08465 [Hymenobacter sp.]|nr:MAG: hypothetical protein EOO60_08465 [Hymenobacter sp.]